MSRVGLGRHGQLSDEAGDPLDGLVNLFDLGVVLAVAFLIAGIALGAKSAARKEPARRSAKQRTLTTPKVRQTASGRGGSAFRTQSASGTIHRIAFQDSRSSPSPGSPMSTTRRLPT